MFSPCRISSGGISTPKVWAVAWTARSSDDKVGNTNIAHNRNPLEPRYNLAQEFHCLPTISTLKAERPVTLPPGHARLPTKPTPTGSVANAKTMGMSKIVCFKTSAGMTAQVAMTSTFRRTKSAAISSARSRRPSAQPTSKATLTTFPPAQFVQSLNEGSEPVARDRRSSCAKKTRWSQLRLLRARRKRPRRGRAAEKRNRTLAVSLPVPPVLPNERNSIQGDCRVAGFRAGLCQLRVRTRIAIQRAYVSFRQLRTCRPIAFGQKVPTAG